MENTNKEKLVKEYIDKEINKDKPLPQIQMKQIPIAIRFSIAIFWMILGITVLIFALMGVQHVLNYKINSYENIQHSVDVKNNEHIVGGSISTNLCDNNYKPQQIECDKNTTTPYLKFCYKCI